MTHSTLSITSGLRQRFTSLFMSLALACGLLPVFSVPVLAHSIGAMVQSSRGIFQREWTGALPPTYATCQANGYLCYSPQEERQAYDLNPILQHGGTGKGQTIVIIDSYGSPTALQDLQVFDKDYGLPDPPSFKQLAPIGSVPFDPTSSDQLGWAEETSLDVQWSHAMAPDAGIVVLTSPVSETQGVQGMPEFLALEKYALANHLGKIISQSWSTTENTLFTPAGRQVLDGFNAFYQQAAAQGVTIFASSGDSGSANVDVNNNVYPFPTVGFPASSPWITAVGGTSLYADANGNYQSETVWNDGVGSATGGGISQYFKTPFYQYALPQSDQALLNGHRGLPDISSNADPRTGVPVYLSFLPGKPARYHVFGGTSESSPTWAGIIADANEYTHHPAGFLNPKLYLFGLLGSDPVRFAQQYKQSAQQYQGLPPVFHDITVGNNAQSPIPGYNATKGWDAATGWGSPVGANLIKALFI